jgi:hypothetical protein
MAATPKRSGDGIPLVPGAYMSSLDRGVWLLEKQSSGGTYWRMPGGFLMIESAAHGINYKLIKPHLPFRRMVPIRKKES